MMKKDCTNCMFEFCCNWEKADKTLHCDDWEDDKSTSNKSDN